MTVLKTRAKLVDVARQLFAKKGVEDTTMNDIAQASKKGRRTLYTYFKSKEQIYMAVVESELEMLSTQMEKAASKPISPDKKILELIMTHLDAIKMVVYRNGTLRADFFRDIWRVEAMRKDFDRKETALFRRVLHEGKELNLFDIDNVEITADILHYCIKGIEVPYIRGQIGEELEKLEETRNILEQKLDVKNQEYIAKGGDIVTQRQELYQKRTALMSKIDNYKEQLVLDAAAELPFLLVKDYLRNIRENSEIEQEQKMMEIALKKMNHFSKDYEKNNEQDSAAILRFMSYINKNSITKSHSISYNMSDSSLFKLQVLLDEQLLATKLNVIERQNKLKNMEQEVNQLDSYLSVDINEKEITRIYKEIKEIEQQIIETNVLIERKTNERRSKNGELMSATSLFNKKVEKYLKKMELNDDSDRIIKYAHMADTILEEYKIRLQKNKISVVALTMTECYKKLANKKTLINRISMDPITLDLYYEDYNGIEINKASLSAGEKQLMVISLLWALALCSKKKLPVIIDTPLSRLDSAHREALITTYFPQASEQTIILSTDSEIDRNYHDMMKNNIGDEFTLIYDDDSKSTTIQRGYFGEGDA